MSIPWWTNKIHGWAKFSQINRCNIYMLPTWKKLSGINVCGSYMFYHSPQHVSTTWRKCFRINHVIFCPESPGMLFARFDLRKISFWVPMSSALKNHLCSPSFGPAHFLLFSSVWLPPAVQVCFQCPARATWFKDATLQVVWTSSAALHCSQMFWGGSTFMPPSSLSSEDGLASPFGSILVRATFKK